MKPTRFVVPFLVIALQVGCSHQAPRIAESSAAVPSPFADADLADLSQSAEAFLEALSAQKSTRSVEVVEFDPDVLFGSQVLLLPDEHRETRQCRRLAFDWPDQDVQWMGEFIDGRGEAVLSVTEGECTGFIRRNGGLILVRPIGAGLHALVYQDEEQDPPEHPEGSTSPPLGEVPDEGDEGLGADTESSVPPEIAVLVAYTPAVSRAVKNVLGLALAAALTTNLTFENSGLEVRVKVVGTVAVDYKEASHDLDVRRLANPVDGFMDSIHAERDRVAADAVILMIDNQDACGWSAAVRAAADSSFAVVHHACADGRLSFAHELGHLVGASHNPEAKPSNVPYAWGHGYRMEQHGWRTVMAYAGGKKCERIPYWSTPTISRSGVPLGTPDRHDNARVIRERAGDVARFRK